MDLNENTMNCKAVIFDLDGTLLDTLGDIADAANRVLTQYGYPTHPQDAYAWFVGNGAKTLMTRALPDNQRQDDVIDACVHGFIADYSEHWHVATTAYPGMIKLINELTHRGIKLSVVTNKPQRFAKVMMDRYFSGVPFYPVLGQQDHIPKKPHPKQALAAAHQMGVMPSDCIFLGDSAVDIETALRAGMHPVGAKWGFRPVQELMEAGAWKVIHHPGDLLGIM